MDESLKFEVLEGIKKGEDSAVQFKEDIKNTTSLAEEFVAFSNSTGGKILIGVSDKGEVIGLEQDDIRRINQMISNVADQNVKPPINVSTTILSVDEKQIIVTQIKEGLNKPYSTSDGKYLIKNGSDKRVIPQEELQRIFQESHKIFAEESVITSKPEINRIVTELLNRFCERRFNRNFQDLEVPLEQFLHGLNVYEDGVNLAGVLLFTESISQYRPSNYVACVSFVGEDTSGEEYRDSEDVYGSISTQFQKTVSFLSRNLRKVQGDQGFNSKGVLEIPKNVLEEVVVNALIHRDYFINSPIRVFVFDNRIEIISPGKLPNSLTVDKIKNGISIRRNPTIASLAIDTLPYRGIGSGIPRVIKEYKDVEFVNDQDLEIFKVVLGRESI